MQNSSLTPDVRARFPCFLVLGAQKAGTTTLQALLGQHPQVFLPACKEVHYFSLHADRGDSWYASHFTDAASQQRCGDITPYYLFHPQAPARIRLLLPKARLVILLRDPVERALSHYFHARRHGFESLELEQALVAECDRLEGAEQQLSVPGAVHFSHQKHSYQARGHYDRQIQAYRALFPDHQILVLQSELLFRQPHLCWSLLLEFLALEPMPLPAVIAANAGGGEARQVSQALRERLRLHYAATTEFVKATYGIHWGW
jgi:hypothetical protein